MAQTEYTKALELAKKLKALADRGEGGEKVNAQNLLERLLLKHSMTMQDLELEIEAWHDFRIKKHQLIFFQQITTLVLDNKHFGLFKYEPKAKKRETYAIRCTNVQAIEIQAQFDFYWAVYERELQVFYKAFILKQELAYVNKDKAGTTKELSTEEMEAFLRVVALSASIKKEPFLRGLKDKQQ